MSGKIGHFDIISQLSESPFAMVYKALDDNSQQTVALKVIRLSVLADSGELLKKVFEEADRAKPLSSHNIAALYGVGDENDLLLASMEYVQGNSIATTLARHEGFSIWDIQDIARQVCHALDHAQVHKVLHHSLEPAKIMVQWDGQVKVLGFGSSTMNAQAAQSPNGVPEVLFYASPEQVRGEACDHRSVLFSLGAILYEMATEQKPFAGDSVEKVREAILDKLPVQPIRLKRNMNRGLSELIMKALAKSPDQRYQSGQELVHDLEQCKSGAAAPIINPAVAPPPKVTAAKPKVNAAAAGAATSATINIPPSVTASAAPAVEEKPAYGIDPMMAGELEEAAAHKSTSFSDITELPPLRQVRVTPTKAEAPPELSESFEPDFRNALPDKPKLQVKEAAQKAVREIRKTPPKLYLGALVGAVVVIALFIAGLALRNYLADRDESSASVQQSSPAPASAKQPTKTAEPAPPQADQQPDGAQAEEDTTFQPEEQTSSSSGAPASRKRGKNHTAAPIAVAPAQLSVNSTPEGAEIAFDGSALCQSPCTLTGIAAGQHTVSASKPGYSSEARTISLASGANSSIALQLSQLTAMLSVASTPAGAVIVVDGKDTGKLTPSQLIVEKPGTHTITLRRAGYLDANNSVNLTVGQTSSVEMTLTHLGSTDEIRAAGGKFKKVFGRSGDNSGMGIVSVKTQPKGAQIMVNNRVLDKTAPFDFYLNPGTYVIDITMSGYNAVHRVISVQEGEKLAIEETLSAE